MQPPKFIAPIIACAYLVSGHCAAAQGVAWTQGQRDSLYLDCERVQVVALAHAAAMRFHRTISPELDRKLMTADHDRLMAQVPGAQVFVEATCECVTLKAVQAYSPDSMRQRTAPPGFVDSYRACQRIGERALVKSHEQQIVREKAAKTKPGARKPDSSVP